METRIKEELKKVKKDLPCYKKILFDIIETKGYQIKFMKSYCSIKENLLEMCKCKYFIGNYSWFSHISHSMGLKSLILKNKMPERIIKRYHKFSDYIMIENIRQIEDIIWKLF